MLEKSRQQFDADSSPQSQPGAMPVHRRGLSRLWFRSGFLIGVYLLLTGLCGPVPSEPARQHPAAYVTKNIEDLVAGDQVLAEDPATGEKSLRRVVEVYRRRVDHLQIVVLRGATGPSRPSRRRRNTLFGGNCLAGQSTCTLRFSWEERGRVQSRGSDLQWWQRAVTG
ncbi:MAG TPA: hypothetical protein VNJ09_03755 [Chthonomonadales bacterium]|nr:hypothetical protein [Chthonomonadales bacterium]